MTIFILLENLLTALNKNVVGPIYSNINNER